MRKLLVIMMLVMLCNSAYADIVYLTDSGAVGRISVSGSDSADLSGTQYTTSWSDPFLGSYWNGSVSRVILVDRNTDTTISGDTALLFAPSDLTRPIDSTLRVLAGVYGVNAMAGSDNGRAVFFASGNSIHEFSTSDFSLTRSYTYIHKASEDIGSEITAMITGTNVIYALVQQDISRDIMLGFDGQLNEDVKDSFKNIPITSKAEAISWLSGSRVAAGHEYGVDIYTGTRGFLRALSTDAPVRAVCQDSGRGFYFIEQSESDGVYTTALKHYSSGTVSTLFTNTEGRICRLVRDSDHGILGVIVGDAILVYWMEHDVLLGEYDSLLLDGNPVQITISNVSGNNNNSSSNGCSMTGIGMMLLLAGACVLSKRL